MSRKVVGGVVFGWMLACAGTEAPAPVPAPVPVAAPAAPAAPAKAEPVRGMPCVFVQLEQGDLLHLVVDLESGEGMSFVCVDDACAAAQGWKTGTPIRVDFERRPVQINDAMTEEMDVVLAVRQAG